MSQLRLRIVHKLVPVKWDLLSQELRDLKTGESVVIGCYCILPLLLIIILELFIRL